jgi:hypothetical protein
MWCIFEPNPVEIFLGVAADAVLKRRQIMQSFDLWRHRCFLLCIVFGTEVAALEQIVDVLQFANCRPFVRLIRQGRRSGRMVCAKIHRSVLNRRLPALADSARRNPLLSHAVSIRVYPHHWHGPGRRETSRRMGCSAHKCRRRLPKRISSRVPEARCRRGSVGSRKGGYQGIR